MILDDFAIRQVFNRMKDESGSPVYWREVRGDGEGYLIVFADDSVHHTYRNPENIVGWTEWEYEVL